MNPKQFSARIGHSRTVTALVAFIFMIAAASMHARWDAPVTPVITSTDPAEFTVESIDNPHGILFLEVRGTGFGALLDYGDVRVIYVNGVLFDAQVGPTFPRYNTTNLLLQFSPFYQPHRDLLTKVGVLRIRVENVYYEPVPYGMRTNYARFSSAEFQFPIRPVLPPDAPSDVRTTVYPRFPTKVLVQWKDNTTNETGFEIKRTITVGDTTAHTAAGLAALGAKAAATEKPFRVYATVGKDVTSFLDKQAYPGSKVEYEVRAKLGATNTAASPVATAVTPPPKACRKPSFDLWSGIVRFRDPGDENTYRIGLIAKGSRTAGIVYRETYDVAEPDLPHYDEVGRFKSLTPPSSNILVGTIVFTTKAPISGDVLQPTYQTNVPYIVRFPLRTEGLLAYSRIDGSTIEPAGLSVLAEPLVLALRSTAEAFIAFYKVPPPWSLAEICLKGSVLPKKPTTTDSITFSIALQNGGPCGVGSGRLGLRLAARGGDISSITSGRGTTASATGTNALINLGTLGPTGTNGTFRDLVFVTVEPTVPSGGVVELDAEVFDLVAPSERNRLLPVGIVVPALRTFAVTVK